MKLDSVEAIPVGFGLELDWAQIEIPARPVTRHRFVLISREAPVGWEL
jgi:hypothetical protein